MDSYLDELIIDLLVSSVLSRRGEKKSRKYNKEKFDDYLRDFLGRFR
ncbi:hypothetical protein DIDNDMLP_00387 [Klebsiella phage KP13-7]|nr:hypothetical protein DIDNDMLP_00387 [Klebsiella phage KP13-7]